MNAIGQRVLFCRSLHMHIMVLGALLMFMYYNILDGDLSLKDFRFFMLQYLFCPQKGKYIVQL